jgi:FkbM family methyltransferase
MKQKTFIGLNIFYREGTSDENVLGHSFDNDIFFKGIPEYHIQKDHTIIDVGAHIGTFSVLSATLAPKGHVFGVEPCLDSFKVFEKNVVENNLKNISFQNIAISDNNGETKLFYDIEQGNWGHSIVHSFSEQGEIVKTVAFDRFFETNAISKCDLIKFNCEGAEFKILLNASDETLKKIRHYVILFHNDLEKKYTLEQLKGRFKKLGCYTTIRYPSMEGQRGWLIVVNRGCVANSIITIKMSIRTLLSKTKSIIKKLIS